MLKELLMKTRSCRSFVPGVKPSRDEMLEIVDCTRFCPSSANLQALKFCPVLEYDKCEKVFSATKWAGYLKDVTIPPKDHESTAYIVICIDKNITKNPIAFYKDTGICAEAMMLCAVEMGYGGCMIGSFDEESVKKTLNLGDNLEISLILALGKPDEMPEIVDMKNGDFKYYREGGKHFVPKRSLEEIIVE